MEKAVFPCHCLRNHVTIVTYCLKFQSHPGIFSHQFAQSKFSTNVIFFLMHSFLSTYFCRLKFCSVSVQQRNGSTSVHTETYLTCYSRANTSSTAVFHQRSLLMIEEPILWWECINSIKLRVETSRWQPVCLVPCQLPAADGGQAAWLPTWWTSELLAPHLPAWGKKHYP